MSNELINAHIAYGEPCGPDADFACIADWAGNILLTVEKKCEYFKEDDDDNMFETMCGSSIYWEGCDSFEELHKAIKFCPYCGGRIENHQK